MIDWSIVIASSAVGGNILLGIGLAKSWVRNGRSTASKYTELITEVTGLKTDVKSLTGVVTNMDTKVDKFQLETVAAIAAYEERLKGHDRELGHINDNMERRKP